MNLKDLDILGVPEEKIDLQREELLKNNDFLISPTGKIFLSTSSIDLNELVEEYLRTDLKINEYLAKGYTSHDQLLDCLIDGLGYVLCIHEKDGVDFRIPKYEISGMILSNIQSKIITDYVLDYDSTNHSLTSLAKALESGSDCRAKSMKGSR